MAGWTTTYMSRVRVQAQMVLLSRCHGGSVIQSNVQQGSGGTMNNELTQGVYMYLGHVGDGELLPETCNHIPDLDDVLLAIVRPDFSHQQG